MEIGDWMDFGEAFEDGAGGVVGCRRAFVDGDARVIGDEVEVSEGAAGVHAEDGHGGSVQGQGSGGSKGQRSERTRLPRQFCVLSLAGNSCEATSVEQGSTMADRALHNSMAFGVAATGPGIDVSYERNFP